MSVPLFAAPAQPLTQPLVVPFDEQRAPSAGAARLRRPSLPGLELDWLDLLAAALTVGKPDFLASLAHPPFGVFEAQRRIALILGNLTADGMRDGTTGIVRTAVYDESDPTEKAGVAYNVAMALTLCFARARLGIGYLTHVDVHFGTTGRTRPDLVDATDQRSFVEVKGATGTTLPGQRARALDQLRANRLGSRPRRVNMASCTGFRSSHRGDSPRLGLHIQHLVDPPTAAPISDSELRTYTHDLAANDVLAIFGPVALYIAAVTTGLLWFDRFDFPGRPRAVFRATAGDAEHIVVFDPYLRRLIGLETRTYRQTMQATKTRAMSFDEHDLRDLPYADVPLAVRGALTISVESIDAGWL